MSKILLLVMLLLQSTYYNPINYPDNNGYEQAEKKAFELRSPNEWDSVMNGAQFKQGVFNTTLSNQFTKTARGLTENQSYNFTVQGSVYWDGNNVMTQIGFTSANPGEYEMISSQHRYLGINKDSGFFYNDGSIRTLVTPDKLTVGWNVITLMMHNVNGTGEILGSIQPKDSTKAFAFVIPNTNFANNVTIQSNNPNDQVKSLKYLSLSTNSDKLLLPQIEGSTNFHTAFRMTVNGVSTIAHIPASYSNTSKNKYVIFFHGSTGSADQLWTADNQNKVLQALLDDGYVVIASDYTSNINWGNAQSQTDTLDLINNYKKYLNLEDQPYVYATSMGGITALNAISKKIIIPKAAVLIYPVTNLKNMFQGGFKDQIKTAYSISNDYEFDTKTKGLDPVNDADVSVFSHVPFRVYSSYQDTLVPRTENTDKLKSKVISVNGSIDVIDSIGEHGDVSNFKPIEILNFFAKY